MRTTRPSFNCKIASPGKQVEENGLPPVVGFERTPKENPAERHALRQLSADCGFVHESKYKPTMHDEE